MNDSRTSRAAKGTLTSFLQYSLQLALQAALAPLVLKVAGKETLGAYAALMQVIAHLTLVDFGLNTTLMRYLSQAHGIDDNGRKFRDVFITGRTFLLISNIIFALLLLLLSYWIGDLLSLSEHVDTQAKWSLYFLAFWAAIRTPLVLYGGGLIATQNLATFNLILIVSNVVRLVLSLGLVAIGMSLIGLMLANILAELTGLTIERYYFRKLHPTVHFGWGLPDKALFREMFKFGFQVMLMNVSTRLVFNSDNIIAGYLYNASTASVYYTTQIPAFVGIVLIFKLADNGAPAINELFARRNFPSLHNGYLRLYRYTLLLAIPFCFGILFFNFPLVSLWVGKEQYAGNIMTVALAFFTLSSVLSHINATFLYAFGTIRILVILGFITGIAKIVLSLWLGKIIGIEGIMVASVISDIPGFIYISLITLRSINISLYQLWHDSIIPSLKAGVLPLCVGLLILISKPVFNLEKFIIMAALFLATSFIGTFLWGLFTSEKEKIFAYVKAWRN